MSDQDPTSIINMIKDLRSGAESYRRSVGVPVRFSGTGYLSSKFNESSDDDVTSPKQLRLDESDSSVNNQTQSDSVPGSPWEWRRMKGEVISLKTRLTHQEAAVQQLHNIRRQMEEVFEKEKGLLQVQAEKDKQTIQQLEVRLDVARRTIQDARESHDTAEKEWSQTRNNLERKIASLLNENAELAENLRSASANEKSPPPSDIGESSELQMKLETAEARVAALEERTKEYHKVQQDYELQNVELQSMQMKLEKLESERALWEEGKRLVGRAARANDLEKELNVAKKTIAALKESVRGKLLLEEKVDNMTKRLEHTEEVEQRVAVLEVKRSELALRLQEYETIGITGGPTAVKRELNRLQQAEVDLRAEEGQLRSRLDAVLRESQNLSKGCEDARKLAADMALSKEKLSKLVNRLQKKMILVTRERDSYRQQLDLYEKEMTVDSNNAMTERIPALERVIDGYRDLVSKLEADLQTAESGVQKNECNKLRAEIEQLRGELEHRALKGDFNCNARVLHFTMNPTAMAEKQAEEKQAALLREVEELRAMVASGNYGATVSSLQTQEIVELKQTHEIKIARLKEAFKASSQEYRQACYQLFGWRVDRTKEGCYKLSSQYAESPDDFLFFHVGEEGVEMLETAFSANLDSLIEQYLQRQHSVPMFLNAVQSDLFSQQTVPNVMT
ncbi:PREDICTED: mitotic spindle assembly checkpoint protein MAD1 [Vollenhovia emeryi]|uniref:mitotic spindle assembly checkpoint protein MAD1 n=1 Tax=Vollenhovia emeryi TaxID=411798 RepID=UPI0005F51F1E|nr:PREDICTED: mitotic spindle assembly checkpoint protein MAD1 [Vollenhovia emeryi]XP_011883238.1 PREDICTED: mitotic spindle assembly checkpoint protein MAD1 [Vollenhovia emeryi]XP_011883239.1 PREDICTED: mitotic spindle assembly checkpoint protein MAD1 [Vollenhovia emeryi]XP_011883240.1 PREDICTED: mitotic spindle assembly checkpoint protein MAD1 [Vollenhovia emeryi]